MLRQLAVIALVALCAHARPIESVEEIPEQYKAMIPKEVLEQLQSITAEEKVVLKELVKKHSEYKNEDEFLAALKEKSPSLHEKALKLHNLVNEKVDKLGDEAKSFVKKVLAEARKIHHQYLAGEKPSIDQLKTISKDHLAAFNALSDGAKEEFKTQFPILTSVFTIEGGLRRNIIRMSFLAALKVKSPSLHEKALKLHNLVKEKVDKLGDEAKSFVKKVLAEARKIHHQYLAGEKPSIDQLKTIAKDHLAAFNALSDGAKEEFKTQFPILTSVFTNPKIKALADQYLQN